MKLWCTSMKRSNLKKWVKNGCLTKITWRIHCFNWGINLKRTHVIQSRMMKLSLLRKRVQKVPSFTSTSSNRSLTIYLRTSEDHSKGPASIVVHRLRFNRKRQMESRKHHKRYFLKSTSIRNVTQNRNLWGMMIMITSAKQTTQQKSHHVLSGETQMT